MLTPATPNPVPPAECSPRVLIVEPDAALAGLYADTLETHIPGLRAVRCPPSDAALGQHCRFVDLILCAAGLIRASRLTPLHDLMAFRPSARVLLLVPPDAPECVEAAMAAGASDVLVRAPGYLEHLPIAVRRNLVLARENEASAVGARELSAGLAEIRRENRALHVLVERLKALATTDPLTALANRRAIEERLDELTSTAARYGTDVSLIAADLDGLKTVNDVLGHQAGDELLRAAAECIRRECRRGDVAGRSGGDEFVVILPHTSSDRAAGVAERVRARFDVLAAPIQARLDAARRALGVIHVVGRAGAVGPLGMTVGVASLREEGIGTGAALLARADQALNAGKRAGKGRVVVCSTAGGSAGAPAARAKVG